MAGGSLVWFRRDLRLDDHAALRAAIDRGAPIIPVFIWSPTEEGAWPPGAAACAWLARSLASLDADLRRRQSRLVIRTGITLATLEALLRETGADAVFWNRCYEPAARERDRRVESALRERGVLCATFNDSVLFEPAQIATRQGAAYQAFTPFWRACSARPEPPAPRPAPRVLVSPRRWPADPAAALADLSSIPNVDLEKMWQPGSAGAAAQLQRFLREALRDYPAGRDRPDLNGTSRLSPHLHFGEISPRRVCHAICAAADGSPATRTAAEAYLRELGWRDFACHVLYHFPDTPERPLQEAFLHFPWKDDAATLRAWQQGETGYPIVDAGMRQLVRTGWMHNRVRMIVASFLVKDLLLPWQQGARWFWQTLVDADLANNTLGWQWSAGCGADAAPYFRIFNPSRQGKRFDPDGAYVRRWVPELARLPSAWIHEPAQAPAVVLMSAGVVLGKDYPRPSIDHNVARKRALAAFARIKRCG